jgi:hypothetical protein
VLCPLGSAYVVGVVLFDELIFDAPAQCWGDSVLTPEPPTALNGCAAVSRRSPLPLGRTLSLNLTICIGGSAMTTAQIHRAVSQATGESVREIRRLGFSLAGTLDLQTDDLFEERSPLVIDWDEHQPVPRVHRRRPR